MQKNTKRALLASVLSLILCVSLLIGSTFAWFTDKASTGVNNIVSGNLDIDLVDAAGNSLEGKTLTFKTFDNRDAANILWEPGCTYELPQIFVENKGNLWVKYQIVITGINGDAELNEVIDWTIELDGEEVAESTLAPYTTSGALSIKGHMQETAGNEYMNKTIEGISITVVATQLNKENDSYGPDYDKLVSDFTHLTGEAAKELEGTVAVAGFNIKASDFVNNAFVIGDIANLSASKVDTLVLDGGYITTGEGMNNLDYSVPGISVNLPENSTVIIKNTTIDGSFSVNVPYPEYPYSKNNVADIVFENCVINGSWMGYPNAFKSVTFKDCVFTNVGMDLENMYTANGFPVWFACYSDTVVNFEGCTFNGNRGIHVDGRGATVTLNVTDCNFNLKAGTASNEDISKVNCLKMLGTVNATLKNNKFNTATAKFDISGTDVTVNESGSIVASGIAENRGDVKVVTDNADIDDVIANIQPGNTLILSGVDTLTREESVKLVNSNAAVIDFGGATSEGIYNKTLSSGITVKNVTFDGNINGGGNGLSSVNIAGDVTFENCTFIATTGYAFSSGQYAEGTATFTDCTFYGVVHGSRVQVTALNFENCTFETDDEDAAGVWSYQNATFKDCAFDDTFSIMDYSVAQQTWTFQNCTGLTDSMTRAGNNRSFTVVK